MKRINSKLVSATLVLVVLLTQSSNLITTVYSGSEVLSEQKSSINEEMSEATEEAVVGFESQTGYTVINKTVAEENGSNQAELGEKIMYTIIISNPTALPAYDVTVREGLLEELPYFVAYNNDLKVEGASTSGDISKGTLALAEVASGAEVIITYSVKIVELSQNPSSLVSITTDNGVDPATVDPEACDNINSSVATIKIELDGLVVETSGTTTIKKTAVSEKESNIVESGDSVNYKIIVSHEAGFGPALDVAIRDSLFEQQIEEIAYNDDLKVEGATYTGNLFDGTLTLDTVYPGQDVTITYSLKVVEIPLEAYALANIVTDNGDDPNEVEYDLCDNTDCSVAIVDVNTIPYEFFDMEVVKSVVDEDSSQTAKKGEVLTYTVEVVNRGPKNENLVGLRDSILESMPEWATYNNDISIVGSTYTGSIFDGTLVLDQVTSGDAVRITYSLTINDYPSSETVVTNIATMLGEDPSNYTTEYCNDYFTCATTSTPLEQNKDDKQVTLVETGAKIVMVIIGSATVLVLLVLLKKYINKK